jgi:hypothetical protein
MTVSRATQFQFKKPTPTARRVELIMPASMLSRIEQAKSPGELSRNETVRRLLAVALETVEAA